MQRGFRGSVFGVLCVAPSMAWAQDAPLAFTGAKIIPIQGSPIDNGVLVVQGGGRSRASAPPARSRLPPTHSGSPRQARSM